MQAGADPRRVQIAEIDEVPLSYLLDPAVRVRVRAIGPLLDIPATAVPAIAAGPAGRGSPANQETAGGT